MTQAELVAATAVNVWTMLRVFLDISILIFLGGIIICFLPKKTDIPLVKMVKSTGIICGTFIAMLMIVLMAK
jgi:hypothetical protein